MSERITQIISVHPDLRIVYHNDAGEIFEEPAAALALCESGSTQWVGAVEASGDGFFGLAIEHSNFLGLRWLSNTKALEAFKKEALEKVKKP